MFFLEIVVESVLHMEGRLSIDSLEGSPHFSNALKL